MLKVNYLTDSFPNSDAVCLQRKVVSNSFLTKLVHIINLLLYNLFLLLVYCLIVYTFYILYFSRHIYDSIEENCSNTQNIISNYSINLDLVMDLIINDINKLIFLLYIVLCFVLFHEYISCCLFSGCLALFFLKIFCLLCCKTLSYWKVDMASCQT